MTENDKLDEILKELGAETPKTAEADEEVSQTRKDKVTGFKINRDIEDGFGEATPEVRPSEPVEAEPEELPELPEEPKKKRPKKVRSKKSRIIRGVVYTVLVLGIALTLAWLIFAAAVDVLGITSNDTQVDVTIPKGASTQQIAEILAENKVIQQPLFFRVYSRLTDADGTYQPGDFTLSANMGYDGLIEILQTEQKRASVSITFPEGSTLADMAALLERKNVCKEKDFFDALENGDFSDYEFVKAIPETENRLYQLEGYLFPDTYEFYLESAATSAVRRFLDNFQTKVYENTALMTALEARELSLDEMVTLASIVQKEDDSSADISKVSRVFWNRLDSDLYPRLQSDITQEYVGEYGIEDPAISDAYDTYVCTGLPAGPICNPGIAALTAAVNPSNDSDVAGCYYFASDLDTGITYYSKTLAQHEAICRKYGIGMYG